MFRLKNTAWDSLVPALRLECASALLRVPVPDQQHRTRDWNVAFHLQILSPESYYTAARPI